MKKLTTLLLALVMLLSMTMFTAVQADSLGFKVAVLTGTTSQGEEEYRAAEALANKYPGEVITDTYPDNFSAEIEQTKSKIVDFAFDEDVKAIIVCQAVPGTAAAFQEIKEMGREDILLIAGVPQEAAATISPAADVVLYSDEPAQGTQIIQTINGWGVDVFIHYSFPRHMAMETIVARHTVMKAAADEAGIEFVDVSAPDPTAEGGPSQSQQFILQDVPEQMKKYEGKKVAFFTTNCGMQEPLQLAVLQQPNAYYPLPCCPSPYHGFPTSIDVAVDPEDWGDATIMLEKLAAKLEEKGAVDRFSTWPVGMNMAYINAGFDYAVRFNNGEFTDRNDAAELKASLLTAAAVDDVDFDRYTDAEGTTYDNYYMVLLPNVDFNDYLK